MHDAHLWMRFILYMVELLHGRYFMELLGCPKMLKFYRTNVPANVGFCCILDEMYSKFDMARECAAVASLWLGLSNGHKIFFFFFSQSHPFEQQYISLIHR